MTSIRPKRGHTDVREKILAIGKHVADFLFLPKYTLAVDERRGRGSGRGATNSRPLKTY